MYVDESGVEEISDNTRYFVVSGSIFHENSLESMKTHVIEFKKDHFIGKYKNAEIHVHDIYKGQKQFYGLTPKEIEDLLLKWYQSLRKITFSTISVAIDKHALRIKIQRLGCFRNRIYIPSRKI